MTAVHITAIRRASRADLAAAWYSTSARARTARR